MAKTNTAPDWVREWMKSGSPKEASKVAEIMRRSGIPDNKITLALEAWMSENPASGEATAPETATAPEKATAPDSNDESFCSSRR
jgi:hypothetical protein